MIFSHLVTSVLLAASAVVQASPLERRDDDFVPGFLETLKNAGLTCLCDIYADFFKTDQGPDLIDQLKCQKLSILAPENTVRFMFSPAVILRRLRAFSDAL